MWNLQTFLFLAKLFVEYQNLKENKELVIEKSLQNQTDIKDTF